MPWVSQAADPAPKLLRSSRHGYMELWETFCERCDEEYDGPASPLREHQALLVYGTPEKRQSMTSKVTTLQSLDANTFLHYSPPVLKEGG